LAWCKHGQHPINWRMFNHQIICSES
jgi:hypothetical protein